METPSLFGLIVTVALYVAAAYAARSALRWLLRR